MAERGVNVDHATLNIWVVKYAPVIAREGVYGPPVIGDGRSGMSAEAPEILLTHDLKSSRPSRGSIRNWPGFAPPRASTISDTSPGLPSER